MPLIQIFYCFLLVAALVLMIVGLYLALKIKKIATGGTIGKSMDSIIALVAIFLVGYVAAFFLPTLGQELTLLLVGTVFLLGAGFVVLVTVLVHRLLEKVLKALETVE